MKIRLNGSFISLWTLKNNFVLHESQYRHVLLTVHRNPLHFTQYCNTNRTINKLLILLLKITTIISINIVFNNYLTLFILIYIYLIWFLTPRLPAVKHMSVYTNIYVKKQRIQTNNSMVLYYFLLICVSFIIPWLLFEYRVIPVHDYLIYLYIYYFMYWPSIEFIPNVEPGTCWNSTRQVFTDRLMHTA